MSLLAFFVGWKKTKMILFRIRIRLNWSHPTWLTIFFDQNNTILIIANLFWRQRVANNQSQPTVSLFAEKILISFLQYLISIFFDLWFWQTMKTYFMNAMFFRFKLSTDNKQFQSTSRSNSFARNCFLFKSFQILRIQMSCLSIQNFSIVCFCICVGCLSFITNWKKSVNCFVDWHIKKSSNYRPKSFHLYWLQIDVDLHQDIDEGEQTKDSLFHQSDDFFL